MVVTGVWRQRSPTHRYCPQLYHSSSLASLLQLFSWLDVQFVVVGWYQRFRMQNSLDHWQRLVAGVWAAVAATKLIRWSMTRLSTTLTHQSPASTSMRDTEPSPDPAPSHQWPQLWLQWGHLTPEPDPWPAMMQGRAALSLFKLLRMIILQLRRQLRMWTLTNLRVLMEFLTLARWRMTGSQELRVIISNQHTISLMFLQ